MQRHLVIIGGGVIGLAAAVEAARGGWRVSLWERGRLGREASWAAVGLLPYQNAATARHPIDRLLAASHPLHQAWYRELRTLSGVDYEFEVGGAVYLARNRSESASLYGLRQGWEDDSIPHEVWDRATAVARLPALAEAISRAEQFTALWAPHDAQLRTPRLWHALQRATEKLGIEVHTAAPSLRLIETAPATAAVQIGDGARIDADAICLAAGAWSNQLLEPLGIALPLVPIRGQVIAYQLPQRPFVPCLYEGGNYLVPRRDGWVLAGSTLEDVGFQHGVTDEAQATLARFAASWLPACAGQPPSVAWSGLRPAAHDGFPYLGRAPGFSNLIVATGHFRAGIHLAPLTARLIVQLAEGRDPEIDLTPFRIGRGTTGRHSGA